MERDRAIILADRIRSLRLKKGLSQKELAGLMGLSQGMVGHFENGNRFPNYDNLIKLAEIFNVDITYLTGDSNFLKKHETIELLFDKLVETGYIKKGQAVDMEKINKIIKAIELFNN